MIHPAIIVFLIFILITHTLFVVRLIDSIKESLKYGFRFSDFFVTIGLFLINFIIDYSIVFIGFNNK